jgi:hypothetical protein
MPTENKPAEPFQREERYIVIKRKDLGNVPVAYQSHLVEPIFSLLSHLPRRECLVIESDWPEYQPVWQMIERRMAGQPPVTAAEELDAVLHWRAKHTQVIRERDALQQRLNAADQKIDELEAELGPTFQQIRANNQAVADALEPGTGRCTFDVLWKSGGSAVDATITEEQYSEILSILNRNVAMLSSAFHGALAK